MREETGVIPVAEVATLDIRITDHTESRAAIKDTHRSKGGARETLYHRADKTHAITFEPVNGFPRKQFEEFLASTESGEEFDIFIYGTESLPITVVREDDGHTLSMFSGTGTKELDYMQASITVMEV